MIYKTLLASSIALAACASGASAQNFSGNLGLSYAQPSDSEDQSITEYFGGLEYAFNRNFSISLDLAGYNFEDIDDVIVSSTWHFIYHLDEGSSVALFAGADVVTEETGAGVVAQGLTFAGLEAGSEFGDVEGETYIGFATTDGDAEEFTMFGVSGAYDIAPGFSAIGAIDLIRSDVLDQSDISVGVEYEITGGPELYGKIGRRAGESESGAEVEANYLEFGASVNFGSQRGTTFNRRSVFESGSRLTLE